MTTTYTDDVITGGYAGLNHELRELANVISRDIYLHDPDVRWDDIIGLDHAKSLVKEAVVYPIKVYHFSALYRPLVTSFFI